MKHSWIFLATHITLLLAPLPAPLQAAEASPSPAKLNVLLIMADDLRDFWGLSRKRSSRRRTSTGSVPAA